LPTDGGRRPRGLVLAALGIVGGASVGWFATRAAAPAPPAPSVTATAAPAPPPTASSAPPVDYGAALVQRFGGKGDGPGRFKQPGAIAVDGDANVFVADSDPSRVHQFDRAGKFVRLYELSKEFDCCVHGMAVDHAGHLYVSFHDSILRFTTSDGAALSPLPPPPPHGLNGQGFEQVAVDPYDMLYGLSVGGVGEVGTVMKYDKAGKLVERRAVKADPKAGTLRGDRLVFDGVGTVFFSHRRGIIEVLDPKWTLQNRIGQEGQGPGELPHFGADALAPDGQGHLLVLANDRVEVFDTGGRYRKAVLDSAKGATRLRAFQVGMDGRLYALSDKDEVVVFTLELGL
jgi:hypothetical protein